MEKENGNNKKAREALNRAMALCAKQEYCSGDIRIKLHSWGLGDNEIKSVIGTLIRENFINEARYANAFVREKFRFNEWGKLKIAAHLRAKKIGEEVLRAALESIDEENYRETVKDKMIAHRKTIKAKNQYDLKGKLMRFGHSRGYETELLYDILDEIV